MKLVGLACLLAVSVAAPVAQPDKDEDNLAVEAQQGVVHIVGAPAGFQTNLVSGHPVQHQAVAFSSPVAFHAGSQLVAGGMPMGLTYGASVPVVHKFKEIDDDDVKFYSHGFVSQVPEGVNVATYQAGTAVAAPVATTYHAGHAVAVPTTYHHQVGYAIASPSVATHAIATPAVASYAVASPAPQAVQYQAAAVAPAAATVHHQAVVQEVKPVAVAVPTSITYQSEHTVPLAPKEINVPVQHQTVHVPVEKRVHYGAENYVAGSTTTVHKPQLNVPAIRAPNVLLAKTRHAAPEVTVHQSEVTVEQKSPNYVQAQYDAGVIVEKATPEVNQVDVPTPVEVPQPVIQPIPYAVPVAHPVKVKSSISPVVHTDVHTVNTENVVTPIEYAAHHHVATAPVVAAAPAVAVQAAQAVATPVTYQAAAAPGAVSQGFVTGGQGLVSGAQAVAYSGVPAGYQTSLDSASPTVFHGGYQQFAAVPAVTFSGQQVGSGAVQSGFVGQQVQGAVVPAVTFSGQQVEGGAVQSGFVGQQVQGAVVPAVIFSGQQVGGAAVQSEFVGQQVQSASVPLTTFIGEQLEGSQTGTASQVFTYSAGTDSTGQHSFGTPFNFLAAPAAQVVFSEQVKND